MAVVQHRAPTSAYDPVTEQYVTLEFGKEFPDDHPFLTTHAWAFQPDPEPQWVESVPIEPPARAFGERRRVGRARKAE